MLDPKKVFEFSIEPMNCHTQCFRAFWAVPENLPYLQGHFPNNPVMPAVAIIDASAEFLAQAFNSTTSHAFKIKSAKFLAPITPNTEVEISLHQTGLAEKNLVWKNPQDETILAKVEF